MSASIYHIFCTETGKSYVGQTSRSLEVRWDEHLSEGRRNISSYPIHAAIRKYGPGSFVFTKLLEFEPRSQQELDDAELYWGEYFDCLVPSGYNLKLGGGNGLFSEESRKKMGDSHRGEKNPWFGKKRPDIAALMSTVHKGKVVPRDVVERTTAKLRGRSHLGKAVKLVETGELFLSIAAVERKFPPLTRRQVRESTSKGVMTSVGLFVYASESELEVLVEQGRPDATPLQKKQEGA